MGAPKRNRKKFDKPKERWNLERIKSDRALIDEYGLKNMKELWKVQTEISRIRGNVRELLSDSGSEAESIKEKMIGRLSKLGIAPQNTTLDSLLDIKEKDILNRRLQTLVHRSGMAKTAKQARQITVHGFISINGRRVNRPGYMVEIEKEKLIGFYKPIDLSPVRVQPNVPVASAQEPDAAEPETNA